jgi:hypothetical protein
MTLAAHELPPKSLYSESFLLQQSEVAQSDSHVSWRSRYRNARS